jgi:hypothetical protein
MDDSHVRLEFDCTVLQPFTGEILNLYKLLFAWYLPNGDHLLVIWTILFAHVGELSIFHQFYSCIWISSGIPIPDVRELPMLVDKEQVSRWLFGVYCTGMADELARVLDNEDSRPRREVLRYMVGQVVNIAQERAHMDKVVPADALLAAAVQRQ